MFEITPRQGLIVYINNFHVVRRLRHMGQVIYVSRRMHYVVMYVNQKQSEEVATSINKLHNVTKVIKSQRPNLDPNVFTLASTGLYKKNDEDEDDES